MATEIEQDIRAVFPKSIEISRGVYRTERQFQGIPFEVQYIDASDSLIDENFDIADYQQRIFVEDYYRNSGSIRWNYYVTFVVPDDAIKDRAFIQRKYRVEQDRTFARKTVLSYSDFRRQIQQTTSETHGVLPTDLVEVWKSSLRKEGINSEITETSYESIVESYIANASKLKKSSRRASTGDAPIISSVDELTVVRSSRPRPKQNVPYKFRWVNLICGPNAVGKTSLLESIELVLCGDTFRSQTNDIQEQFEFRVRLNGSTKEDIATRLPLDAYRDRDRKWYGNVYAQENLLPRQFARFNFFDADAAQRFSEELNDTGLNKAILGVAFGPEAATYEKRLINLAAAFKRAKNRIADAIANSVKPMEGKKEQISSKKARLETLAHPNLQLPALQLSPSRRSDVDHTQFISDLGATAIALRNTCDRNPDIEAIQLKSLGTELVMSDSLVRKLSDLATNEASETKQIEKQQKRSSKSAKDLERIGLLRTYVRVGGLSLLSVPDRLQEVQKQLDALRVVVGDIKGDEFEQFRGIEESMQFIVDDGNRQLAETKRQLNDTERQRATATESFTELRRIRQEILERGVAMLAHVPDLNECPLCGARHKSPDLSECISLEISRESSDGADLVAQLSRTAERLKKRVAELQGRLERLHVIQRRLEKLAVKNIPQESMAACIHHLERALGRYQQLISEKEDLERTLRQLESAGFARSSLVEILSEFQIPVRKFERHHNEVLSELETLLLDGQRQALGEIEELRKSLAIIQQDVLAAVEESGLGESSPIEALRQLRLRATALRTANTLVEQLRTSFIINDEVDVDELVDALDHVHSAVLQIQEAKWLKEELVLDNQDLVRIKDEVQRLGEQKERARHAVEVIETLVEKHGLDRLGAQFLSQNVEAIRDRFLRIHAPREFSDIRIQDGFLELIRKDNKKPVKPHQLSTGQRSALALSVFLTINKMLNNGPNLLLLDDPVTYVDDLNVLAFIDFLRDLAIGHDRQIFFATANNRIADVFRAKMDFLGDELAHIVLGDDPPDAGQSAASTTETLH